MFGFGCPRPPFEIPSTSSTVQQYRVQSAMTSRDRENLIQIFSIRNRRRKTLETAAVESPPLEDPGSDLHQEETGILVSLSPPPGTQGRSTFVFALSTASNNGRVNVGQGTNGKKSSYDELLEAFATCPTDLNPNGRVNLDQGTKSGYDELLDAFASCPTDPFALPKDVSDRLLGPFSTGSTEPLQKPSVSSHTTPGELVDLMPCLVEQDTAIKHGIQSLIEQEAKTDSGWASGDEKDSGDSSRGSSDSESSDDSDTGTIIDVFQTSSTRFQNAAANDDDLAEGLDNKRDSGSDIDEDDEDSDSDTVIFVPN